MIYVTEVWDLDGGWTGINKINRRFCKKILALLRFEESSGLNWRRKALHVTVKDWLNLLHMNVRDIARPCYE
jgi:hypothetical protein